MAFITNPTSLKKGEKGLISFDANAFIFEANITDSFFSDKSNWSKVSLIYLSPDAKQKQIITLKNDNTDGDFKASDYSKTGEWVLDEIIIHDHYLDTYSVKKQVGNILDNKKIETKRVVAPSSVVNGVEETFDILATDDFSGIDGTDLSVKGWDVSEKSHQDCYAVIQNNQAKLYVEPTTAGFVVAKKWFELDKGTYILKCDVVKHEMGLLDAPAVVMIYDYKGSEITRSTVSALQTNNVDMNMFVKTEASWVTFKYTWSPSIETVSEASFYSQAQNSITFDERTSTYPSVRQRMTNLVPGKTYKVSWDLAHADTYDGLTLSFSVKDPATATARNNWVPKSIINGGFATLYSVDGHYEKTFVATASTLDILFSKNGSYEVGVSQPMIVSNMKLEDVEAVAAASAQIPQTVTIEFAAEGACSLEFAAQGKGSSWTFDNFSLKRKPSTLALSSGEAINWQKGYKAKLWNVQANDWFDTTLFTIQEIKNDLVRFVEPLPTAAKTATGLVLRMPPYSLCSPEQKGKYLFVGQGY